MAGKKKDVIVITESLYGGGVQRILQIVLSHFNYSLYEVTLYTVRRESLSPNYFPNYVRYKYVFDTINNKDPLFRKIWYIIKNKIKLIVYYNFNSSFFYHLFIHEKPDVAIAFIEGYATRLVSGFPNFIKKIAWLHTDIENNHWSTIAFRNQKEEQKIYISSFDKIVCVSKVVQEKLIAFSERNVNNAVVLHNPIDRQLIIQSARKRVGSFPVNKNSPIIISIGSLTKVKGYDRLLSVASKLRDEGASFYLIIIGEGVLKEELKTIIENNSLSSFVCLMGYQENPYPFLLQSDFYVCSSYAEGYSTAITEALVLGKAVVATECSGVKEQLGENNEWGICVPNSEEGLYYGLKLMLKSDIRDHYARMASMRGEFFTLEKSMSEIYQLIEA